MLSLCLSFHSKGILKQCSLPCIGCHEYLGERYILILVPYLIQCMFISVEKFKYLIVNYTYIPN